MQTVIITVLGDDRTGLVDRLSGVVASHDGNWVRSHLTELAGKFAGIVEATVPDRSVDALLADLDILEGTGLLHITAERATVTAEPPVVRLTLSVIGQDHPGIVHEISEKLAALAVSIDQLETEVVPAPQGGRLFRARAELEAPVDLDRAELESQLEAVAHDLMVDVDVQTPG